MPDSSPPMLVYAVPRVYFQREYKYRSGHAVLGSFICAVFAAMFGLGAAAAAQEVSKGGQMFMIGGVVCCLVAIAAFAAGGYLLIGFVLNRVSHFAICEDGIHRNRSVWTWDRVARVWGSIYAGGSVSFFYILGKDRVGFPRAFQTTPPMTIAEYAAIATALARDVVPNHPHLQVAAEAVRDD